MGEEVDHILPLASGGSHQDPNLQTLCGDCHKAKTAQDRRAGLTRAATPPRPRGTGGRITTREAL